VNVTLDAGSAEETSRMSGGGGMRPRPRRVALRRGTGQRRGRADARGAVPGELCPAPGGDRSRVNVVFGCETKVID
jgi:hypothetical protein